MMKKPSTVDSYLSDFSGTARERMDELRAIIRRELPDAEEVISYSMPSFKMKKVLVYYAAWKDHIGFYPTAGPMQAFEEELKSYYTTKGSVHFPYDKPIPAALVRKIVKHRVA